MDPAVGYVRREAAKVHTPLDRSSSKRPFANDRMGSTADPQLDPGGRQLPNDRAVLVVRHDGRYSARRRLGRNLPQLKNPTGVTVDASGDIFIADQGNNVIREVTPDGIISTIAGTGGAGFSGDDGVPTEALLSQPQGVFTPGGGILYVADTGNNRIRKKCGEWRRRQEPLTGLEAYGSGSPPLAKMRSP